MSDDTLAAQIRDILTQRAPDDPCITYRELAEQLGLPPPGTIQRVAVALEQTMREDVPSVRDGPCHTWRYRHRHRTLHRRELPTFNRT